MRVTVSVLFLFVVGLFCPAGSRAQSTAPLPEMQRAALEQRTLELLAALERMPAPHPPAWADAAVFAKGLAWGLRYDREFTAADVELLKNAVRRCEERINELASERPAWTIRRGKTALGYQSSIDGSVQPYGVIIPAGYDPTRPIRLDVVLHGSTKPVGMSELRFMSRFDEGDAANPSPPDAPFIEMHPLGRVENCYRWAGEADVFEAIADVCRRFNIDRDRIVLRGMSMGASGTWHLGLKHPDRFVALGPYCGYVDTHRFSETPIPEFVRVGPLPPHQELGLHMLDSIDYAANAGIVPAIACMGEKDIFFEAHELMKEAMRREGLTMINLISPGTGHVIDPVTHTEQMRQIGEHVAVGLRPPRAMRFVTWTLKYNRSHWLEILGLDRHYAQAEFSAKLDEDSLKIDEPRNISRFAIDVARLPERPARLQIGATEISLDPLSQQSPARVVLSKNAGGWRIDSDPESTTFDGKRPGLQGPIDDAFTTPFLCVRGTGKAWNPAIHDYAEGSLQRFADEWQHYFRGELPVKNDVDVTEDDVRSRNLILFGDPGSNPWIARVVPHLPLHWTPKSLEMAGRKLNAADYLPALIAPSPLKGAEARYVVLNSGHTFRGTELSKFNYLLFPRWGDWAIVKTTVPASAGQPPGEEVLEAGHFDERWQHPLVEK